MTQELKISKLDAAKRQLEVAINLYFHNGDSISIHTLTAAVYNVLRGINKHRKGNPLLIKEQLLQYVKPENKKEFIKKINEAENFFKHVENDPEDILTFQPESTEYLLMEACETYLILTKDNIPLMQVFRFWFILRKKDYFEKYINQDILSLADDFKENERTTYFNYILPIILKQNRKESNNPPTPSP